MKKRKKLFILCFVSLFSFLCTGNISQASQQNTKIKVFGAYGGKDKIFAEFTKDTGIKIEYLDMSSGEVLARIRAEKGNPLADIWFGGGVDSFIAAQNDGLLMPYISKEAKSIPTDFKDPEGYWTGISLVTISFIVNKGHSKRTESKHP